MAPAAKPTPKRRTNPKAAANSPHSPAIDAINPQWAREGDRLTTAQGLRVSATDDSLKAGNRGPTLLEDFHLREKIMHFDHERIPERAVHARGAAAHGHFEVYESLGKLTRAAFLNNPGTQTPVFVRFSTVAGSRGSSDTARDVRGFATKLYTSEGNFDLVGNNIPIFFIQDGIKFPDLIHSVKPEPDREIPQAASAHDTFWDFASLQPESTHMLMWAMSDRAIPRSFRTMEGFGIHTFRLVNAKGKTSLVKFHWKPVLGKHSLVWEESQKLGGIDPDFHRRDLWDSIEAGAGPEYELGLQVMPDSEDQTFEGIDLLDPTKIVPEEICPVQIVGKMTLDTNPTNYFAETEQVAFHPGHVVPGIDITDDPLLQARLFSYLDTQLTRLGGPNFSQIPINRPVVQVNDNHRDGFGQQAVHEGKAAYFPNSVGGGCPFLSSEAEGGYVHFPKVVNGPKLAERAVGFKDFYSQATLFWNSMSGHEKAHIVGAFSFELSKVEEPAIRERMLGNLANVAADLTQKVAANLGMPAPKGKPSASTASSPALSMVPKAPGPINGRVVGVMATDGVDAAGLKALDKAFTAAGARVMVIASHGGSIAGSDGTDVPVAKTAFNTQSVEFDAVVLADGTGLDAVTADPRTRTFFQEAFRHCKTIAAWGKAADALSGLGVAADAPGVVAGAKSTKAFADSVVESVGWHRHWEREQ